nr:thymidine kinase [Tamaricihabitans halophyticus]
MSPVPGHTAQNRAPSTGRLRYCYGPMDCGKSTLALQIDHNHARQGRRGLLLVRHDRSGQPRISSRIGITRQAYEVGADTDIRELVRAQWAAGHRLDYLIVDEAQFLSTEQVEQLAELADDVQLDVYCFGIATDFRSRLFPGSQRLFELADELQPVQVDVLCWCGAAGRFNARVQHERVLRAGDTVLVADTEPGQSTPGGAKQAGTEPAAEEPQNVRYQVLCRRHYRQGDLGATAPHGQLRLA